MEETNSPLDPGHRHLLLHNNKLERTIVEASSVPFLCSEPVLTPPPLPPGSLLVCDWTAVDALGTAISSGAPLVHSQESDGWGSCEMAAWALQSLTEHVIIRILQKKMGATRRAAVQAASYMG